MVQECLANIEKHAEADEISVLVSNSVPNGAGSGGEISALKFLRINVSDNGMGFTAPNSDTRLHLRATGHLGLWNMYERAEILHGILSIDSEKGGGTRITLELPLKTEA
jgi:signal transduction histidine kinase